MAVQSATCGDFVHPVKLPHLAVEASRMQFVVKNAESDSAIATEVVALQ